MVCYVLDLLNVGDNVRYILAQGGITVRRINKSFAQWPVDLALEHTVSEILSLLTRGGGDKNSKKCHCW